MIKSISICVTIVSLFCFNSFAQKSIQDYLSDMSKEKIQDKIIIDENVGPAKKRAYKDGHGKNPYFLSSKKLPDTIALVTFNISDDGIANVISSEGFKKASYEAQTENDGNMIAEKAHALSIDKLKDAFEKQGVVLLTPAEYLNSDEKKTFYYDAFRPKVSKVGKFLENSTDETKNVSVSADSYRLFDTDVAFDYLRAQSLGYELANKLGVDAVLSISLNLESNKKQSSLKSVTMAINGPNPTPKMKKKYVAQKTGNGYYDGQLYIGGSLNFPKPIKTVSFKKNKVAEINFEGLDDLFENFIEKFYDEMDEAIKELKYKS